MLRKKRQQERGQERWFRVTIKGTTPLIQNNPAKSNEERLVNPNPTRTNTTPDPQEEWRCLVYQINEDGTLGHPAEAMEMAMAEAALEIKGGKRTLWKPITQR